MTAPPENATFNASFRLVLAALVVLLLEAVADHIPMKPARPEHIAPKTNAKAIYLDLVYPKKYRKLSNILTVNRKVFEPQVLEPFSKLHDCCLHSMQSNYDHTKVRYYHDGDFYEPHTDNFFDFLAFSYFYREPKRFEGGELFFPKYNYSFSCNNNSIIIMPAWVQHGVTKVSIKDSDYYDGFGRYAITSFFGNKEPE